MLRKAHEMGVTIVAGSDAGSCGVPHGIGFLQELEQMQRAGLPPMAVLQSATSKSADTLAFPEKIGRVAPGHRARFILTRDDPSQSIANLMKAKTIIFDGQAIDCPDNLSTAGL
jgi:imidazolonepropionase-like amidohydrolase